MKPRTAEELARRVAIEFAKARSATRSNGGGAAAARDLGPGAAAREARAGGAATADPPRPAGAGYAASRAASPVGTSRGSPERRRSADADAANKSLARFVDHTLLKATATSSDVVKLCHEAREHHFAAVCVNPAWVDLAVERLRGSDVAVATVIGFPLGASTAEVKAAETEDAIRRGAGEVDMVAQIGRIKEGAWSAVAEDIRAVVEAARGRALVKVILETAALEPLEMIKAAALAAEAGADFVKTSTGFHPAGGASAEAVAILRLAVGADMGVKASGGVRSCEDALRMIAAGATRLGTSSGIELVSCYGHLPPPIPESVRRLGYAPPAVSGMPSATTARAVPDGY